MSVRPDLLGKHHCKKVGANCFTGKHFFVHILGQTKPYQEGSLRAQLPQCSHHKVSSGPKASTSGRSFSALASVAEVKTPKSDSLALDDR